MAIKGDRLTVKSRKAIAGGQWIWPRRMAIPSAPLKVMGRC